MSSLLLLSVFGAVVLLGFLNAGRPVGPARVVAAPTPATTLAPTPAVTARVVISPTATSEPTAQAVAAPTAESTPTPEPSQQARVANTDGQGAVVRAEPGSESARSGTLREGAVVTLTGREQTVAARLWREIVDETRDIRGWVLADLLEPLA